MGDRRWGPGQRHFWMHVTASDHDLDNVWLVTLISLLVKRCHDFRYINYFCRDTQPHGKPNLGEFSKWSDLVKC